MTPVRENQMMEQLKHHSCHPGLALSPTTADHQVDVATEYVVLRQLTPRKMRVGKQTKERSSLGNALKFVWTYMPRSRSDFAFMRCFFSVFATTEPVAPCLLSTDLATSCLLQRTNDLGGHALTAVVRHSQPCFSRRRSRAGGSHAECCIWHGALSHGPRRKTGGRFGTPLSWRRWPCRR